MRHLGATALMALLVTGCSGAGPTEPPEPIPERPPAPPIVGTDTDTGTEVGALGPLSPDLFWVTAFFAYEEEFREFVPYAVPDVGLVPMAFAVTFQEVATRLECSVILEIDQRQPLASWVLEQPVWAGMTVPSDATVTDGCLPYRLPDEFGGDVAFHVTKWDWGFGVGNLDTELAMALEQAWGPAEWGARSGSLIGGVFYSTAFEGTELSPDGYVDGWGTGFEVDGNFQIDTDGVGNFIPLDRAVVNAPGGIATGYYEIILGLDNPSALTRGDTSQ